MWEIKRYDPLVHREAWDTFVRKSRNSTFLFMRNYMDYHADRFQDASLMAFRKGRLSAILPANIVNSTLHSHQGLSYGGWILPESGLDCADLIALWGKWIDFCINNGIEKIIYKPLPDIYHRMPSEEDRYLLFLSGASLDRTDISSTINLACNPGLNKLRKRNLAHSSSDLEIKCVSGVKDISLIRDFHEMLSACLRERHHTEPVHSLGELSNLMEKFPENIKLCLAYIGGKVNAGICMYITPVCHHSQYIATTPEGREKNLLTPLFDHVIKASATGGARFFDFGISTEAEGRILNAGLNRQKTSFGASGSIYTRWTIDVAYASESLRNAQK